MAMRRRPFRILADFPAVRAFLLRVYERDWRNGVPAPFLEYALSADWADQTLAHRDAVWEDDRRIVAFCFYESRPGTAFFALDPAYPRLADEMIGHACERLAADDGSLALQLFEGQRALSAAAAARGFAPVSAHDDLLFDLRKPLDYPLPDGYRFLDPAALTPAQILLCCWKGFDHEPEGPWDGRLDPGLRVALAPNATPQYAVAIEHIATAETVCYAGMWWTPENRLAYMEPLCTVPRHRRRGLAAAALSEMARRMRPLGALCMTGGASPFYRRIGYEDGVKWVRWEKKTGETGER